MPSITHDRELDLNALLSRAGVTISSEKLSGRTVRFSQAKVLSAQLVGHIRRVYTVINLPNVFTVLFEAPVEFRGGHVSSITCDTTPVQDDGGTVPAIWMMVFEEVGFPPAEILNVVFE